MVVSDDYKYLFLEMPFTASTATSRELIDHYKGKRVFDRRHAPYDQFRRIASPEQRNYFVFAGVRNPLDTVITTYLKSIRKGLIPEDLDFPTYFDKKFRLPYANFMSLSAGHIDFLIRYESLQADFENCLKQMEIEKVRPLPSRNRTNEKSKHYLEYYTADIIPKAKRIFGPFMKEWGYDLPTQWGEYELSDVARATYRITRAAKVAWWSAVWQWKISPQPV